SPTHYTPAILEALIPAVAMGLRIPLVYNTNGYDSIETIRLMDGIVDLYLPDMKYSSDVTAARLSAAVGYRETSRNAVKEMYRQVGPLRCDSDGIATKGVIVRHLVLPGGLAGSYSTLRFVATRISTDLTMSLMSQYTPLYKVAADLVLGRKITGAEYSRVISAAGQLGFQDCFIQDPGSAGFGVPDFGEPTPFHW
ncbi:radical SAM protein, partial [Thermodesulfobacteriota bacterium]